MTDSWAPPENHPISNESARQLMQGELADVYRATLRDCCAPIYWYRNSKTGPLDICDNGTMTFVNTGKRLIGITAAHVLEGFHKAKVACDISLQIMNARPDSLDIIDCDKQLDIATIAVEPDMLNELGKTIKPLSSWPPLVPEEGRGIMLAGYPGLDRIATPPNVVNFGLFTALGIARRVSSDQITWLLEREHGVRHPNVPDLPPNRALGGISGGPLVGWFETPGHLTYPRLCGIICEASDALENVVARRADFIGDDGTIDRNS